MHYLLWSIHWNSFFADTLVIFDIDSLHFYHSFYTSRHTLYEILTHLWWYFVPFHRFFQCMLKMTVTWSFFCLPKRVLRSSESHGQGSGPFKYPLFTWSFSSWVLSCFNHATIVMQQHVIMDLYNALSVVSALEVNKILNFWVVWPRFMNVIFSSLHGKSGM